MSTQRREVTLIGNKYTTDPGAPPSNANTTISNAALSNSASGVASDGSSLSVNLPESESSQCHLDINISPYISKFVRILHQEYDYPIKTPFSYTQFGAVLMVDIMTSIASSKGDVGAEMLASQIGDYFDLAIRVIELHGGDVVKFLGDALLVVFQPDPELGNSTPPPPLPKDRDPATVLKRHKLLVRRAIECGLELLARLSNYRIYLDEREFQRRLSEGAVQCDEISAASAYNNTMEEGVQITPGLQARRAASEGAVPAGMDSSKAQFSLFVNGKVATENHSSVASKPLTLSAVGGENNNANNSALFTDHLCPGNYETGKSQPQSDILDFSTTEKTDTPSRRASIATGSPDINANTKLGHSSRISVGDQGHVEGPGGLAGFRKRDGSISSVHSRPSSTSSAKTNRAGMLLTSAKQLFHHAPPTDRRGIGPEEISDNAHDLQLHMALSAGDISNIIIGNVGNNANLKDLLMQETGRLEYAICSDSMSTMEDALNVARAGEVTITQNAWKYVNADAYPWSELRGNCYILKNIQHPSDDMPLLRRVRNDSLIHQSIRSNPHFYKYINKSAIHRLFLYPDSTYPAQFRNATILFISLGAVQPWTPEGLALCQKAMSIVHKVTTFYQGYIQQFAVDDKGATILCAFGLPSPRSHESEAIFAAKSAWLIRTQFLENDIHGFKLSLATGVIFTSTIGNEFRRDPAIVGDTIVIAVRILKFDYAEDSIVCDEATMIACNADHCDLCVFEDRGEEFVKGKVHPLHVYRLVHFGAKRQTRRPLDTYVDEMIGYCPEKEKVNQFIGSWFKNANRNTIVIAGARGSGKSMFYQQISHIADNNLCQICAAVSVEVEKNTEYYPCKFLLLGIFDIMRQPFVPFTPRVRPIPPQSELVTSLTNAIVREVPHRRHRPRGEGDSSDGKKAAVEHIHQPTNLSQPAERLSFSIVPPQKSGGSPLRDNNSSTKQAPEFYSMGDRRQPSVFSADMAKGSTPSQCKETSSRTSTNMTKLQASINICLSKMGQNDPMALPVLSEIIANISSDDSQPAIDAHDDKIFVDFIVNTLNYASNFVKIIAIFEDVQWCDYKTLNVIKAIHEGCPSVLVVLFTRPLKDYGNNTLSSVTNHSNNLAITLDGLKRREIEQALLKTFQAKGVTTISPEVVDLVQIRTQGNPLFVKEMANALTQFSHVNIVDGELLSTGQDDDFSEADPKTLEEQFVKQGRKKTTLMQYDRVGPKFQEFLRIASCLGERFSLAEVAAIRPLEHLLGTPEQGRTFSQLISDLDTYKFLKMATDQQTNRQFSDNAAVQTIFTFGSPSTAKDIYDSIPYEERVMYHLRMGQFYESFLARTPDGSITISSMNCQDLLPEITRHYLKTDCIPEQLKYLKALADFHLKSNMLTEATHSINEIIRILDVEPGARRSLSKEDLAEVYAVKGEVLAKRMRIEEAETALMVSVQQYGIFWPSTKRQWKTELLKKKLNFLFHYHLGGMPVRSHRFGHGHRGHGSDQDHDHDVYHTGDPNDHTHGVDPFDDMMTFSNTPATSLVSPTATTVSLPQSKNKLDTASQVRLRRIIRVFSCLQNIYFWRTHTDAAMLSSYYTLYFTRRLGVPSGDQTASLARIALLLYFQGKKHKCELYMHEACMANKAGETTEGMLPAIQAYVEYSEGRREEAHRLLDIAIGESKSFGVICNLATFYRAVTTKCAYRLWEGALSTHPEDCQLLRTLSMVAIQNGDTEGEALFAIPTLANLMAQDRYREAESWVVLIEKHIMPKMTQTNLMMVHGLLTYYYVKTGDSARAWLFLQLWVERVVRQGYGAHPFPLLSCLFVTMATYELHGNSTEGSLQAVQTMTLPSSLSTLPQSHNLSHEPGSALLETAMARGIQYLKAEPYAPVAATLTWLADAVRMFIQNKEKEGVQKLVRGYREVAPRIDGLNFLHAYYLTRLGRHHEGVTRDDYFRKANELIRTWHPSLVEFSTP
ncbi:hypothetical protein BG004_006556 [Podila humilis]|nr:hypothetical protein BG004_006556 [Podila humilis]